MKKIIPVLLVLSLALGLLFLTGCGDTLSQETTDGLNLEETLESGVDEMITDLTDELTDMAEDMTDMAEDLTSATDEALPQDTTVVSETEAE